MSTKDQICSAIQKRQLIEFVYDRQLRTVEPHILWGDVDGNTLLDCWEISESRSISEIGWKRFRVEDIGQLRTLEKSFPRPRPGYNPHSERYETVYCSL
jgi:hypothetical protein